MGMSTRGNPYSRPEKSHLELKEEFCSVDRDLDGVIDSTEFEQFIHHLDIRYDHTEIVHGFSTIDTDHDGRIGFAEFLSWWRAH